MKKEQSENGKMPMENAEVISSKTVGLLQLRNRVCNGWSVQNFIEDSYMKDVQHLVDAVNEKADELHSAFNELIVEMVKMKLSWEEATI